MTNTIRVPKDTLIRLAKSLDQIAAQSSFAVADELRAILSAQVVEGELEAIAWQDAENPQYTTGEKRQMHGWATDGYPIVELIRLSDATAVIDQLRARIKELEAELAALKAKAAVPDEPVAWMWEMHGWIVTAHGKHRGKRRSVDVCRPPESTVNSDDFIRLVPLYASPAQPQSDAVKVPRELLVKLLDEGRRAETWAAQDELRALLGGEA